MHDAQKFEGLLRIHAPIHMNAQHLESFLDEQRRKATSYTELDRAIHIEGAAGIKLETRGASVAARLLAFSSFRNITISYHITAQPPNAVALIQFLTD
jgi:hypothetical protein